MLASPERPADLVLKNGQLVNVFSGEVYPADVAISGGLVSAVGDLAGERELDLNGRYLVPGFIDSHLHPESTLLDPLELARAVLVQGTTALICDPGEITAALGPAGLKYLLAESKGLPVEFFFTSRLDSSHRRPDELKAATLEEAREKLRQGRQVLISQGSIARNLPAILPLIGQANSRFFSFCTDDLQPDDLINGHLNSVLRQAVAGKLDPVTAVQMATINPALYYGLKGRGAIAPGYFADLNVVSNLEDFTVDLVFKSGIKVAVKGKALFETPAKKRSSLKRSYKLKTLETEALALPARSDYARVIELAAEGIMDRSLLTQVRVKEGLIVSDPKNDVLKLAVIEPTRSGSRVGLGLVKGFGLKCGALATSVSHGAPGIIAVGVDDEDMLSAVRRVARLGGGLVVVRGGLVLAELPLPVGGLMSDQPLARVVEKQLKLEQSLKELAVRPENPFGRLSFLSKTDLPELRLTAKGLFDVGSGKLVELFK